MTLHLGNVPAGETLYIPFASYGSDGQSITLTGLIAGDIEVYKDGSVTQRSSDAGYALLDTDGIDFDSITGIHGFSIDLSDNTDAGFYAVGSQYWVVVSAVTIDTQTVNFIAATFRIVPAEASAGVPDVNVASIDANAITATAIASDAITAAKVAADVHAEAADANWDEARSGHVAAGSFGEALQVTRTGTAQAGGNGSITLDTGASATNDIYIGQVVAISSGTGADQSRIITDYNGTTKVATVLPIWVTNPSTDSVFIIRPYGPADVELWKQEAPNALVSGNLHANVATISLDATAANNLEALLDGTGGVTLSGDLSGSVGSVTGLTEAGIADAVLDEALSGHTTAGTLGQAIADIETEVDKLDAAQSEPTGVPAANDSPLTKIGRLHMALRNQLTITATKMTFFDDGGAAEWEKDLSDDGTTYTETEASAI
jgi:hypothetical protein